MDRNAIFWAARLLTGVIGFLFTFFAIRVLGRARAAASWPTAAPVSTGARPLGWAGVAVGLLGVAVATGSALAALAGPSVPTFVPGGWRAWLIAIAAVLVVLAVGTSTARRMLARAELTALIRTPPQGALRASPAVAPDPPAAPATVLPVAAPGPPAPRGPGRPQVDPAVPADGRSGWVYRDPAGRWYLAVATDGGQRLVRLTDFTLVPVGVAETPLALAGSVEISVWPVTDAVPESH